MGNSSFSGSKRFGHETDNSPPASAEVKISGAGPLLLSYPSLHGQGELPVLCLLILVEHNKYGAQMFNA